MLGRERRPTRGHRPARGAAPVAEDAAGPATEALFEALRRHRLSLARAEGVAPFIIASDRTLRDIAAIRPATLDDLRRASGIGEHKVARYGAGFLEMVASHG